MTHLHQSLDFLGNPYLDYQEAESEYVRLRKVLFGEMREKVRELVQKTRNSDDSVLMPLGEMYTKGGTCIFGTEIPRELIQVHGINVSGGVIVSRNHKTLEGYNGNPYVFGDFFGSEIYNGRFTTCSGENLEIQFEREKAKIIEKARYDGIRYREGVLFQELMRSLGNDCKAIYLYSGGHIQNIRCFVLNRKGYENGYTLARLGNWDYVDSSYWEEREGEKSDLYQEGTIEALKSIGILNPNCIQPRDDFEAKSANNLKAWENATSGNKTTRIISAHVGAKNWPPEQVQYGTYDIAYAESDQTYGSITVVELLKLAKIGGFIVIPKRMLMQIDKISSQVKVLLGNPHGDFSIVQRIV